MVELRKEVLRLMSTIRLEDNMARTEYFTNCNEELICDDPTETKSEKHEDPNLATQICIGADQENCYCLISHRGSA